ncbi:MAG: ABC transporter permease subunit [Candidatus Sericytochromatia bacterium]|nr:ABC transporter permease subunit [Candidatus Sericytochromatia bacterium]
MRSWAIAGCVWREAVREQGLRGLALGLLALLGLAWLGAPPGEWRGPAAIDFFYQAVRVAGACVGMWLTTRGWARELENRTTYVVLTKPISRTVFLLGRYLGVLQALGALALLAALGLTLAMAASGSFEPRLYLLCLGMYLEWSLVCALALLFAAMTAPLLATLYTLCFFLVGHFASLIRVFAETEVRVNLANYYAGHLLYAVLPHFDLVSFQNQLLYSGTWPGKVFLAGTLYLVAATAGLVLLAAWAWEERELS